MDGKEILTWVLGIIGWALALWFFIRWVYGGLKSEFYSPAIVMAILTVLFTVAYFIWPADRGMLLEATLATLAVFGWVYGIGKAVVHSN